ncbi:MAG: hypothetical protein QM487_02575, partial [Candidatus Marithrix sp.]
VTEYCLARNPVGLYIQINYLVFTAILVVLVYNVNCLSPASKPCLRFFEVRQSNSRCFSFPDKELYNLETHYY